MRAIPESPRGGGVARLAHVTPLITRYGLAIVIAWFAAMKFT
jgi:hypothetical protein